MSLSYLTMVLIISIISYHILDVWSPNVQPKRRCPTDFGLDELEGLGARLRNVGQKAQVLAEEAQEHLPGVTRVTCWWLLDLPGEIRDVKVLMSKDVLGLRKKPFHKLGFKIEKIWSILFNTRASWSKRSVKPFTVTSPTSLDIEYDLNYRSQLLCLDFCWTTCFHENTGYVSCSQKMAWDKSRHNLSGIS